MRLAERNGSVNLGVTRREMGEKIGFAMKNELSAVFHFEATGP